MDKTIRKEEAQASPACGGSHEKERDKAQPKASFLCTFFTIPELSLNLPPVLQKEIVKKWPCPFKPLQPKPQELTHADIDFNDTLTRVMQVACSNDGSLCAVAYECNRCFVAPLKPHQTRNEIHTFPDHGPICAMAFSLDDKFLMIVVHTQVFLCTLDKGNIVDQVMYGEISLAFQVKVKALTHNRFIIAWPYKHIVLLDAATRKLTILNKEECPYRCNAGIPFTISTINGENAQVVYVCRKSSSNQLHAFDVETRQWIKLPELLVDGGCLHIGPFAYNGDRSILATYDRTHDHLYLWNLKHEPPFLISPPLDQVFHPLFRNDSNYVLVFVGGEPYPCKRRLYSVRTGAAVVEIPRGTGEFMFSPQGESIISVESHALMFWPLDPNLDEYATFFAEPLLILQYLFIKYVHELGSCGLTLNAEGLCQLEKHNGRITDYSTLSKDELQELKDVFLSFKPQVQKYLRLKYRIRLTEVSI